jgi:regulator of PEP synthase PpsR (kinase-PPPase family)
MRRIASYFHLHLVSDSTGETIITVARAVASQYLRIEPIEHIHAMVRNERALERILPEIERHPGIVLFTLVSETLAGQLVRFCQDQGVPCLSVLGPIHDLFRSYLNVAGENRAGAQHSLDASYFRRIEAMNFTMAHDDGQLSEELDAADVVLVGVSRSSKTPTSIYLANRGVKVANIPFVPDSPVPATLMEATRPLVVGLTASPDRIAQIRENRLLALGGRGFESSYVDRHAIAREIAAMRRLCMEHQWPVLDVTRRSIEETAAEILTLLRNRPTLIA